jgi:hypothetical protein
MKKEQHEYKRAERRSSLHVGLQLIKHVWIRTVPAFTRISLKNTFKGYYVKSWPCFSGGLLNVRTETYMVNGQYTKVKRVGGG